jgi:carboxypeptidase T
MVDNEELWVVPVVNPDGRWIVDLGLEPQYSGARFFQRKNADRDNGCNSWPPFSSSQYGIDLNRNSSFLWNTGGSSGSPCSETYRGPTAASEVEVSALQDLVASLIPDRRGDPLDEPAPLDTQSFLLTLHSYGNEVLRPWGTTTQAPPNETQLAAIGAKLATYNHYQSCQVSRCLYETSGTTDEWSYGELGVASFTFEIGNEFMPPYGVIDSQQWPDNGPAFLYIARIARMPYTLVDGPDARNLALIPIGNGRLLLRAVIDDRRNGNAVAAHALYSVDEAYWQNGYAPRPLQPSDGAADSPVESYRGLIDTRSLGSGRHTVYVRGIDAAGNAGPVSAIFLNVP